MKLAFTIHWYGGLSAGLPTTQDTYIADICEKFKDIELEIDK